MEDKNTYLENELRSITDLAKERIRHVSEDVYKRVAQTLNDEIKRLYTLIEEFDRPFSSERDQIPLYKQDLHHWVEDRLDGNLQTRLHTALYFALDSVHNEIKERVKSILTTSERQLLVDKIIPRSDFAITYRLDCSNLCSDFREDIQFKFSLGLTSLWERFLQESKTTSNDITTKSGLIALGACGLVWRSVGWKILGVAAGIYGSLYLYERLMWTKNAQERAFKRQYADYASSKMKLIVDLTSGNASAQVQQELSMYFAETIRYVAMEKDDVIDNIQEIKDDISQLKIIIDKGKKIKKQGDKIDSELNQFSKQYLLIDATN
jgi:mitofusin